MPLSQKLVAGCALALLQPFLAHAQSPCLVQELVPSVPHTAFGLEVVAAQGHLLVSSPSELNSLGVVYAFQKDTATGLWLETQRLEPSFRRQGMSFGLIMDSDGERVVITAPGPSQNPNYGGAAFVFELDQATQQWTETNTLVEPAAGFFGVRLQLEGDRLAITDAWEGGQQSQGRVYFYHRDPASGDYEPNGDIGSFEAQSNNRFADAIVYLDDRTVLLGDSQATAGSVQRAGVVRVVEQDPVTGAWSQVGELTSPDPETGDRFGVDMAWDGWQLMVSEQADAEVVTAGGSVNVFEQDGSGGWTLVQNLNPGPSVEPFTYFGTIASLEDGELMLRRLDRSSFPISSTVERWLRDQTTGIWRNISTFQDPFLPETTNFGDGLVQVGRMLVIGSGRTIAAGVPIGRAFVYDLAGCDLLGLNYCNPATPTSLGAPAALSSMGSPNAGDNQLTLRATDLPPSTFGLLLASQQPGSMAVPGSSGPLCLAGAIGRFVPGIGATTSGSATVHVDITAIPTPFGITATTPGDTWHFQLWFRDAAGGAPSNFTNASRVVFQ